MKLIKNICIIGAAVFLFSSCKNDLLDTNPWGSVNADKMWTTEHLADQGVNAIYSALRYERVALELYWFDAYGSSTSTRDNDENLLFDRATSGDALFSNYWQEHYEGIHRANEAIAYLDRAPLTKEKLNRLVAESKFLRAFFYYKLNMVYKGVPLYLEPVAVDDANNPRASEKDIWDAIISDLTDCINESDFPDRPETSGRIAKSAAYALRGKVYLWTEEWAKAESDFKSVGSLGHKLFQGAYKELFKEANENSDENIFSLQHIGVDNYGNTMSFRYGTRVTFGSCWNTFFPNADFVDSYEYADGRKFDWDDIFPGYSSMAPAQRAVYFLRDNLTPAEITTMTEAQEADMTKYLPTGNEARLLAAYTGRDPRLTATVITPYSEYLGANGSTSHTYTLRWPYRGFDGAEPFDVRTDTNNRFYYLYRKFVAEGANEIPNRSYSPIDYPIIRYADVVLGLAEALNEQNKANEAIAAVNEVRRRAGAAELNSNANTQVSGQAQIRERIQKERSWEFNGEGVTFFDELRWKTLKDSKFFAGAGLKQIWGQSQYTYSWSGDKIYQWPIPRKEVEMNSNLIQSDGWKD